MIKLDNKNDFMKIIKCQEKPKMNIDDSLTNLIAKLKQSAGNYVTDSDYYRTVTESVRNSSKDLCCKAFSLTVEQTPDNKARHFLSLNVLPEHMRTQLSRTLAAGNKQEILETLKSGDFKKNLKTNLLEMNEDLKDI